MAEIEQDIGLNVLIDKGYVDKDERKIDETRKEVMERMRIDLSAASTYDRI